ncbi:phosphonate transport system permease protein [Clostridium cavendishii DSM 21758]|uniref:Phosphonate transport system permease protein n=1 Tax=Clostridium cavendishii DSM 21758 TaxID=1121302 RepID=A0A1M6SLY4_9CLOT|nr:ABC transporter permease subunit [Clostridium cavendishii]SHK45588.1 phosphonate transport system permease protein [Clostridium cavendishii DSM 21758]
MIKVKAVEINTIRKRNIIFLISLTFLAFLTVLAMNLTDYDPAKAIVSVPKALIWMFTGFIPNKDSLAKLPDIISKMIETIFLSITATTTASIFSLIFSLFGSETTKINNILTVVVRFIASIFRNVPDVVWSMILLFSFGQNILTGYFALFFVTFGTLTRAFIEAIDESSYEVVEALQTTGASYFQVVAQGVIPSTFPQILSWILFMIETNIRSSALIGLLTGTGIGFLFNIYYKTMQYNIAGLVVIAMIISVLIIETLSNYIRRVIL